MFNIKEFTDAGYRVFESVNKNTGEVYGWYHILTPNGNILYAQYDRFEGWLIALEYRPSRENGSGCMDNTEKAPYDLTVEYAARMEISNLMFSGKMKGIKLYSTFEEFSNENWCIQREVTA